jgi:hypothetical protein
MILNNQRLFVIKIIDNKGRKKTILRLLYDDQEAYSFGYTKVVSVVPLFSEDVGTAEDLMKDSDDDDNEKNGDEII